MHVVELLHKTLEKKLPEVHKIRLKSLMTACEAAIKSSKLYLTELGRTISNTNKESSNIQKIDRLLGNGHLSIERESFYKAMISHLIQENTRPWIHVDWTCINPLTKLYALRASLSMPGRTIVLYEECHPKAKENNHPVHKAFLDKLKTVLPETVKPIIIADAGFRAPWFAHILKLEWDFVGRLRNKNAICMDDSSEWELSSVYFKKATGIPNYIGHGVLTKEKQVPAHFVLYRGKSKGRTQHTSNKKKRRSSKSKRYSKANHEPWFLVTSLSQADTKPSLIATIYSQRMRIEENIRDTKCPRYGLGLKTSLTKSPQRMNILLLIAALATFAAWLAGLFIKKAGQAADFQARSSKFTKVISTVFLGRQALKKNIRIHQSEFQELLKLLALSAIQAQQEIFDCG